MNCRTKTALAILALVAGEHAQAWAGGEYPSKYAIGSSKFQVIGLECAQEGPTVNIPGKGPMKTCRAGTARRPYDFSVKSCRDHVEVQKKPNQAIWCDANYIMLYSDNFQL